MTKKTAKKSSGRLRNTAKYMGRKAKAALSGAEQAGGKAAVYVSRKAGKTASYLGRNAKDALSKAEEQSGQTAHYMSDQAHETLSDVQSNGGRLARRVSRQMPGAVKETISQVRKEGRQVGRAMQKEGDLVGLGVGQTMRVVKKSVRSVLNPGYARCSRCGRKFPIPGHCEQCALEMKA